MSQVPDFAVISGAQVHRAISGQEKQVMRLIEAAYRLHGEGATINPDSYFLRFPDRPSSRIIALPASVGGDIDVHVDELGVHDLSADYAEGFRGYLERAGEGRITIHETAEGLIRSSDLIVFATVAGEPHLAEQRTGHREFLAGTLYDVLNRTITPPADRPVIFSPFGLGVLDLAVARHVYAQIAASGDLNTIPGFFHEVKRYGC